MFDAIVVGSGISGGWAAMELCKRGLKTLMIERGRQLLHGDYPNANKNDWELPNHNELTLMDKVESPIQTLNPFMSQANRHLWIKDQDGEYLQTKPFHWFRGDHVGGRSLMWGRQCYRLSDIDFESNLRNGVGVDWPIRYADIEPWYDYVEKFIGVSGSKLGIDHLPDGIFLPPMKLNKLEREIQNKLREEYSNRFLTIGRAANITKDHQGRPACQNRNRCSRGCPLGSYFSTQSSTLPVANSTGNLTLKTDAVVQSVVYDDRMEKAIGVRFYNRATSETETIKSKIIFINASTLGSTSILLNSKSNRFPNGLGNDSGQLGKNLMDHHYNVGAIGTTSKYKEFIHNSNRPNVVYLPRFRNLTGRTQRPYVGGFAYQGGASRIGWRRPINAAEYGASYKNAATEFGDWQFSLMGYGECLPYESNRVELNPNKKDKFGMPLLDVSAQWGKNEHSMRVDMQNDAVEMLERVGLDNVTGFNDVCVMGANNHEMGTARMGKQPNTSVLNKWNQIHAVKNVFVTDGACMTSSACQNPSLTYMALTARAANFAVDELNKQNI